MVDKIDSLRFSESLYFASKDEMAELSKQVLEERHQEEGLAMFGQIDYKYLLVNPLYLKEDKEDIIQSFKVRSTASYWFHKSQQTLVTIVKNTKYHPESFYKDFPGVCMVALKVRTDILAHHDRTVTNLMTLLSSPTQTYDIATGRKVENIKERVDAFKVSA